MASLVDIGVNLTNKSFRGDLDQVIERALAVGVDRMIVTGTSVEGSQQARELALARPGLLFATAGVHPHHASDCDDNTLAALEALAMLPEVVAVGECGLDYNRNYSPPDAQRRWFAAQAALAGELELPLFLHERDAHDDFVSILREHRASCTPAVIHCFTGSEKELEAYLELGLHIGITGWICDERRGKHLLELLPAIPLDRLLLETDAPYLLPRDLADKPKNRRNEPAFLAHVLERVAQCLALDPAVVAETTTANADRFFGLPGPRLR